MPPLRTRVVGQLIPCLRFPQIGNRTIPSSRQNIGNYENPSPGQIWGYRDPNGGLVGFGTVELSNEYVSETGANHPYIPLLGVNPSFERRGHGTEIVRHLIGQAVILVRRVRCHEVLFLDVYLNNPGAIRIYEKPECGFKRLPGDPKTDSKENNEAYIIMTKSLAVAKS
jgi:ribosomal protein S18 acetylase RimI-like enzyme